LSGLLAGAWEFVVGDDWRLAVGVVLLLGLTAILAATGIAAWWLAPVLVPLLLLSSIRRALRAGP
jgi:hypothetical protein